MPGRILVARCERREQLEQSGAHVHGDARGKLARAHPYTVAVRWGPTLVVLLLAGFALVAAVGTATRGVIAEEVAPYLRRHTLVLEGEPCAAPRPAPPYEPGAPAGPRLFSTSSWPILAYDGETRMWPVLIRAYQSAIAGYVGIAVGPLLGGGIAGVRRSTILLGCLIIVFTASFARGTSGAHALWTTALLATSFGMIASARTGYGFELGSREAMMAALALLAPRAPPGRVRAGLAGLLAAVAIASRATIALAVVPALVVVLWRSERRSNASARVIALGTALLVPVVALGVVVHLAPLRAGTGPLASFVPTGLLHHLALIPRLTLVHLAWLGDSMSIWGPLYAGQKSLGAGLWPAAALAAVVVVVAIVRTTRRAAGEGEVMLLAAGATTVAAAALLYRNGNQFQLALPLEPLFALAGAEQIVAAGKLAWSRASWLAGALALVARVQGAARGMALDAHADNPMLSGAAQRSASQRLAELGARGPEVVTTTYNHAGVVEAWTDETVRPIHAWPLFVAADERRMRSAWKRVLATYHPRYVLLTEGSNLVESGETDVAAIERTLEQVAASVGLTVTRSTYATEGGAPGWAIATLEGVATPADLAQDEECGTRFEQSVSAFAGVSVGDRLDDCVVSRIEAAGAGGARFRLDCPHGTSVLYATHDATYSIAPGHGAGWGITYRNDELGGDTPQHLAFVAAALGDLLTARQGE